MRTVLVGTALAAFLLSGCSSICALCGKQQAVNNYAEFYRAEPGPTPERIALPTGSPQVIRVGKYDASVARDLTRKGYELIGSSSFTSGRPEADEDAIEEGVIVGADLVVLLNPAYQGTVTASVPITTPTATTSYTNGTAMAYGSGPPVMAYGNSTTTTYGTSTTYMPMTVERSAYAAGYFIKRRYPFGADLRDLTDSERQQLQTNRGAYVVTVIDNTPAYSSDILPGDVIVGINGQSPSGYAGVVELINANRGRTVDVSIVRAGKQLSKHVSILE